jgi:thymidylate synthase
MKLLACAHIRNEFIRLLHHSKFVTDKSGVKMIEIVGASFVADEPSIFGKVDEDYVKREIRWYGSHSLNVNDIPDGPPTIWRQVANADGWINSNYGYLCESPMNGDQKKYAVNALLENPFSRRSVMIYTRPSMHSDYCEDGMDDFVCTNVVQYVIRDGQMDAVVQMRSNDVIFGYRNDWAWQNFVLDYMVDAYNQEIKLQTISDRPRVKKGSITWQVGSLHVYERHFKFVETEYKRRIDAVSKIQYCNPRVDNTNLWDSPAAVALVGSTKKEMPEKPTLGEPVMVPHFKIL